MTTPSQKLKNFYHSASTFAMLCGLALGGSSALAGVTVMGTRVIYKSTDRDVTVELSNSGATPSLVQAWVDLGDPKALPETIDAPFVLSPPMFRMDPNRKQNLRMVFTGRKMPDDRESIFWLNILEIPPKPGEAGGDNYLQFSVRNRLKIFYRPAKLPGDPSRASEQVKWQMTRDGETIHLLGNNPTPYFVNLAEITLNGLPKGDEIKDNPASTPMGKTVSGMIEPMGKFDFIITDIPAGASPKSVRFTSINDWGGYNSGAAEMAISP